MIVADPDGDGIGTDRHIARVPLQDRRLTDDADRHILGAGQ